ncbi:MAG: phosphonate C-P lyase system protein PhnG, partial [Ktedonobacteraceae bacterium]|nr:phosphonate C-P lyase system protein PhnG [Ktedonobacteraceae bacterium]
MCQLASIVLKSYEKSQVKLLSGPRQALVMLRVRETVANSLFHGGEVLVTEVKLELDEQFGFGIISGDRPRQ